MSDDTKKNAGTKIPDPKEIEKELGDFLNKKFGGNVKIVSPAVMSQKSADAQKKEPATSKKSIDFDIRPKELISWLDQFIIKQDAAKATLATKICTHFNRIRHIEKSGSDRSMMVGGVKSNILLAGPTGVGKTYMVKLIANKIGVPFVKGDATKFTETGYVGGNVEDLVRDLVREADDDIELAQYGIVYIDEIDKIASAQNRIGADISRTGVQRALLKPMEDTDVELKVPHDPVSMLQEMERFQQTGKRDKQVVNTANILFIMSGAFGELSDIIRKRTVTQSIGFGAEITNGDESYNLLSKMATEDLIKFGFETEFVGRLPIRAILEKLTEDDLYSIMKNPNNPVILGKKLDFAAYGISIKFTDEALRIIAKNAYQENTGARGLVNAIESALLRFETRLPSEDIRVFPVTPDVIEKPDETLQSLCQDEDAEKWEEIYNDAAEAEYNYIRNFVDTSWKELSLRHNLTLTQYRIDHVASYYCRNNTNIGSSVDRIRFFYDEVKRLEMTFFSQSDINIIFEEDAVDFLIEQFIVPKAGFDEIMAKLSSDFELGLKLIMEKTGKNRFFISREGLDNPQGFLDELIRREISD